MPARVFACPNCGGQVEFKAGRSLLSICPYCASAVARLGDDVDELTLLGKVAPLADLGSPLSLGLRGKRGDRSFSIIGRLQLEYGGTPSDSKGSAQERSGLVGRWNEWYAAFDDGTWGWIAEAQGKVYLTFETTLDLAVIPSFSRLSVGSHFEVRGETLVVVERREARFITAEGELPIAVRPGESKRYCDVQGPNGIFGTIDFDVQGSAESLFLGHELEYGVLFDRSILREARNGEAAAAVGLNCPNCGASVELKAPDESQRVVCGTCGSLLDCSRGNTLYLLNAEAKRGPDPALPLSSTGVLFGQKYTVFGYLVRSVVVDGIRYAWAEYLLHAEGTGYRWLVESAGHWSFVEPAHVGDVRSGHKSARHQGRVYRHFQSSRAEVDHLRGEFYWKVEIGEAVHLRDFVSPPYSLSQETTADEVVWSRAVYVPKAEIEAAWKLRKSLPSSSGVAPNQPNPHGSVASAIARRAALFSVALILMVGLLNFSWPRKTVMEAEIPLVAQSVETSPQGGVLTEVNGRTESLERFHIDRSGHLAVRVESDVDNGGYAWLYLSGRLANLTTNELKSFGVLVPEHRGDSDNGGWQGGGREREVYLGEIDPGEYTLQLVPSWSSNPAPTRFRIEVTLGNVVMTHGLLPFLALWLFPLFSWFAYLRFENKRWSESDHAA